MCGQPHILSCCFSYRDIRHVHLMRADISYGLRCAVTRRFSQLSSIGNVNLASNTSSQLSLFQLIVNWCALLFIAIVSHYIHVKDCQTSSVMSVNSVFSSIFQYYVLGSGIDSALLYHICLHFHCLQTYRVLIFGIFIQPVTEIIQEIKIVVCYENERVFFLVYELEIFFNEVIHQSFPISVLIYVLKANDHAIINKYRS